MLALLFAFATLAVARPGGPASLADQVDSSTLICIGTVDSVVSVSYPDGIEPTGMSHSGRNVKSLGFGRIQIERVIKGDVSTKVAYHEAWMTWSCDSTHATVGQRSLFFLGPGVLTSSREQDRLQTEAALQSQFVLRARNGSDGVLPIDSNENGEFILAGPTPLNIRMPGVDRGVRIDGALAYIRELVKFSPDQCQLLAQHDRSGGGSAQPFDLRILPDGQRRFAIRFLDFERVAFDTLPAVDWRSLQENLTALTGDTDRAIGHSYEPWDRHLSLRANGKRFDFWRNDWKHDPEKVNRESNGGYVRALHAWTVVRASLNCDVCADDREADEKLIAELSK